MARAHYEPISTVVWVDRRCRTVAVGAAPPAAALLPNADSENAAKAAWLAKNSDQAAWGGPQATSTSGMVVSTAPGALVAPSTNAAMEFEAQGRMYTDRGSVTVLASTTERRSDLATLMAASFLAGSSQREAGRAIAS